MEYLVGPHDTVHEDPRLREAERGVFHTYTPNDVENHFPLEKRRKALEGLYHYRPPGGENWPDVELRIHSFLSTVNRDMSGANVLIVAHGHWLILFQRLVHHFSIQEALSRYEGRVAPNASVTTYISRDGSRLELEHENFVPWEGQL